MAITGKTSKVLPPAAGKGRTKGVPNKTTKTLKEAILLAAEKVGEDGKGKDGLTGYLVALATKQPKSFAGLLGRVLPLTLQGAGPNGEILVKGSAAEMTDDELAMIARK